MILSTNCVEILKIYTTFWKNIYAVVSLTLNWHIDLFSMKLVFVFNSKQILNILAESKQKKGRSRFYFSSLEKLNMAFFLFSHSASLEKTKQIKLTKSLPFFLNHHLYLPGLCLAGRNP